MYFLFKILNFKILILIRNINLIKIFKILTQILKLTFKSFKALHQKIKSKKLVKRIFYKSLNKNNK